MAPSLAAHLEAGRAVGSRAEASSPHSLLLAWLPRALALLQPLRLALPHSGEPLSPAAVSAVLEEPHAL